MKELIKTTKNEFGEILVNGRELHNFLEVKTEYKDWFPRMVSYGFIENTDFSAFLSESTGGRPRQDHAMTLDMAKEISMIQRTSKGKQARQYFLQVEKAYRKQEKIPVKELLLQASLEHEERLEVVEDKIELLETEMIINSSQRRKIRDAVNSTVSKVLGSKKSNAYNDKSLRSSAFRNCYKEIQQLFDVASYLDIPKARFDEAINIIPKWKPHLELQSKIDFANGTSDIWKSA